MILLHDDPGHHVPQTFNQSIRVANKISDLSYVCSKSLSFAAGLTTPSDVESCVVPKSGQYPETGPRLFRNYMRASV